MTDLASESMNETRIAIVAGDGVLPAYVAQSIRRQGREPYVFMLENIAHDQTLRDFEHEDLPIGKLGHFLNRLRELNCSQLLLLGAVVRPQLADVKLDFGALKNLPQLYFLLKGGDDAVLTKISSFLEEKSGARIIGVKDVAPEIMIPKGNLTEKAPNRAEQADIDIGVKLAQVIGDYDVGQAVIAFDGRVIAIEGIEGTDQLLRRTIEMKKIGRVSWTGQKGIFAKIAKPNQDQRLDLPTIGPATVELCAELGLSGMALEANNVIVIDRDECTKIAQKNNLFILGL